MARTILVGTRGSKLALAQTNAVVESLRRLHPGTAFEVREVRTQGDVDRSAPLSAIGGQGVFVKELEGALQRREVDLAVHSLKDVPPALGEGLTVAAVPERADVRDAVVTGNGAPLAAQRRGARIGTGSRRRAVQLAALRPDLQPLEIRGNVDTRLRKARDGEVEAVLLAVAGLERLGWRDRATEVLPVEAMLPAVGQGALALEAREDDREVLELLRPLEHPPTRTAVEAERAFLGRLGGGCALPVAAYGIVEGDRLHLRGLLADAGGERVVRSQVAGSAADAVSLGVRLAEELLTLGGDAFRPVGS